MKQKILLGFILGTWLLLIRVALNPLAISQSIELADTAYAGGLCSDGSEPIQTTWDFSQGAQGWATAFRTTGALTATWQITSVNAPGSTGNSPSGGNKFFAIDMEGEGAGYFLDQWLTSPAFEVPLTGSRAFTFWNLQAFEISDSECWDSGWVEVSDDGGVTWDYLNNTNPTTFFTVIPAYDFNIHTEFDAEYPQADAFAWCSGTPDPGGNGWGWRDWAQNSVDLSPYAGETIQVRFHSFTDNAAGAYGWLVDDITTRTCPSTGPIPTPTAPGNSYQYIPVTLGNYPPIGPIATPTPTPTPIPCLPAEIEENDTVSQSRTLPPLCQQTLLAGEAAPVGELNDFFRIEVPEDGYISIFLDILTMTGNQDVDLMLYNNNDVLPIAADRDTTAGDNSLNCNLVSGTYFIRVIADTNVPQNNNDYTLRWEPGPPTPNCPNTFTQAPLP